MIIGCGMGNMDALTVEAQEVMQSCGFLLGAPRLLEPYDLPQKACLRNDEIIEAIHESKEERIGVLVSGDPGFFSASKKLLKQLDNYEVRVICGISSLAYFCAELKTSWDDAAFVSAHGRDMEDILPVVAANEKVFILTGGENTVSIICQKLTTCGFGMLPVAVGQDLSQDKERITCATVAELATQDFGNMSVMLVWNPDAGAMPAAGIPDDAFVRGDVPMTKFEVRSVSVAKLRVCSADIVYDIGAGSGSMSIELARHAYLGKVYALEQNERAIELIKQNIVKFRTYNLAVIHAKSPDGLDTLPPPNRVFIGGSNGSLKMILDAVLAKNPAATIVVNAITLETLNEAVVCMEQKGMVVEVTQVSASRMQKHGGYHMMQAQNPVFIICGEKKD